MDFHSIDNLAGLEATPQPPVVQQQLPTTTTTSGCACDAIAKATTNEPHYLANFIDNNKETTCCEEAGTNNLQLPEHVSTTSGSVNNDATNSDANGGETRVQIRRKTMENKNQIVKSPEFIARIKVALSVLNLAILHDLLIRCSSRNVVYDNNQQQTDKKKCRNCNNDEQKKKCIEHKVAEILYRAEKVSVENANQFLAMLSSSSSTKEWHVHILLPRKSNPGAKEQRNTSQKHTPFLFHSVCWQPVAFLCVLKRGIPVLPRMLACVANCNSDTTIPAMTFCINPYHFEPQPSARLTEQQQQPILFNDNQRQQQATTGTNISEDPEKKALREQNEELRKQLAQFQQQQGQQQHMIAPVAQHAREHDNWQIGNEQQTPIASSSIINYPDGNYNNHHYLQQLAAAAMQASCSSSNMAYPAADLPMANSSWLPPQLANLPSSSNCTINDGNNNSSSAAVLVMEVDDEEDHQSATTTTPSTPALSSAVVAVTDSLASIQLQNRKRAANVIMPVKGKKMKPRTAEEEEKQKQRTLERLMRKNAHKEKKSSAYFQNRLELAMSGIVDPASAHNLLVECNLLHNSGETKKRFCEGSSHTTPESKAKCIKDRVSELLFKAEQCSPENANNLAAMLADTNAADHNCPDHIYWPWKCIGAKEPRNRRQKHTINFHHQSWPPENLLKIIKQGIKIRPMAMEQKCDGNNAAGICINPYHYRSKAGGAFDQQRAQETQRPFDQPQQRATTSTTTPFELVPPSSTAGLTNAGANYCPNTAVAGHSMTTWLQSLGLMSQPPSSLGSLLSTFTAPTSFLQQAPAIAPYAQAVGTGLADAGAGANCFPSNTAAGPPPTMMPQTFGQMLSSPSLSFGNLFSTVAAPTLLQQEPAIAPYAQAAAACSQFFAQLPPGTMNSMLSTAAATVQQQQSQQQLPHKLTQSQPLPSNLLNSFPTTAGPLGNNTYLSQLLANILLKNQQPPGGGGGNTQ